MQTLLNFLGSPFVLLANLPGAILRLSLAARITLVVTVFLDGLIKKPQGA